MEEMTENMCILISLERACVKTSHAATVRKQIKRKKGEGKIAKSSDQRNFEGEIKGND